MARNFEVFLVYILCFAALAKSANILFLSSIPSPSHGLWNYKIIEELASTGHNVTVLSPDAPRTTFNNTHIISMSEMYTKMYELFENVDTESFMEPSLFEDIHFFVEWVTKICILTVESNGFKTLLKYPDNFQVDLIIHDFTGGSCLLGFLHKFNYPPLIGVSAYKYTADLVEIIGGHHFTAYIPRALARYTTNMSIFERLQNTLATIYEIYCRRNMIEPAFYKMISPYFKNLPEISVLEHKTTIVLLNTNSATDYPVPLPPNVIEVGGLQIVEPGPLPDDIREFIEKAVGGTVLVSFGTNVNSYIFREKQQQIIVDMAKQFPNYNFLWKFDTDISAGKVSNLLVKNWIPQNDLLAHPKIKAFVTHGGGLSTQEATYYGVPMVAVPFFADQKLNSIGSVQAGVALRVDASILTQESLIDAVREILENKSFAERIKLRSSRFKARPLKPLQTAVWWVEYILSDPNPTHLRSPVLNLGHLRANCIDLILYAIGILISLSWALQKICRRIFNFYKSKHLKEKTKIN